MSDLAVADFGTMVAEDSGFEREDEGFAPHMSARGAVWMSEAASWVAAQSCSVSMAVGSEGQE